MKRDTNEMIRLVYSKLDYTYDLEDRMRIVEELSKDCLEELNDQYVYYYSKCRNDYNSFNIAKSISKCLDSVSDYLLHEVGDEEYPFTKENNFEMMEKHKYRPILPQNQQTGNNIVKKKMTIKDYLERDDVPDYILEYIEFSNSTRYIIEQINKQIEAMPDIKDNHIFFYKTRNGKQTFMSYDDFKRLKRVTGYTKNNSIVLDREILGMLDDYYETLNSNHTAKNSWTDILNELNSDEGIDIDLLDRKNIELLLKGMCYYGDSEILDVYFKQIDDLRENIKLTKLQSDIYKLLQNGESIDGIIKKTSLPSIAEKLGKSRSHIYSSFNSMVTKFADEYERLYEDYYYTYVVKGKYKTCSECGKVYLASRFYFYGDSSKPDGLKSQCKSCIDGQNSSTKQSFKNNIYEEGKEEN